MLTYISGAYVDIIDIFPDEFWPIFEESLESWTDEVRVDLAWVLGFGEEADNHSDHDAEREGDGAVPHVGDLVDWQMNKTRKNGTK